MFTQPVPSPPTLATTTSPVSPTRPSRLRGLSYLRNYTHNHLHSRDGNGNNSYQSSSRLSITRPVNHPSKSPGPTASGTAVAPTIAVGSATQQTSSYLPRPAPDIREGATSDQSKTGPTSGWLPTVGGRSGVTRIATQPQSTPTASSSALLLSNGPGEPFSTAMGRSHISQTNGDVAPSSQLNGTNGTDSALPSIKFLQHQDVRAPRPSLVFSPMSRTLPTGKEIIRVGRYSERDSQSHPASNVPSASPVGFKSKVVSRKHCEFWHENGSWYIKDVKSSSGTFLNHVRLSSPGLESKPFPVKDGDIVQLGIDFKGGEEMIFRCVKIRIELNRGWQNSLNSFNVASHKRLRNMAKQSSPTSGSSSQDCTICLGAVAPCQSLFVAPCSHTWHYKCVRRIINGPLWPQFICPNCRAVADLEADVEEPFPDAEWEEVEVEDAIENHTIETPRPNRSQTPVGIMPAPQRLSDQDITLQLQSHLSDGEIRANAVNNSEPGLEQAMGSLSISEYSTSETQLRQGSNGFSAPPNHHMCRPSSRNGTTSRNAEFEFVRTERTPSPSGRLPLNISPGNDGPMTPRNDAGPFILDGQSAENVMLEFQK